MTEQEAIKYLKLYAYGDKAESVRPHSFDLTKETSDVLIAMCEKHIAKKVIEDGAFGLCPNCNSEFNSELRYEYEIDFCPKCGQALDFSEDEQ